MNKKEKDEMMLGTPTEESSENLNAEILKLQEQLAVQEEREAMEQYEEIELPLASALLKLDDRTVVPVNFLTPPEVLILAAMHGPKSGGRVFENITKSGVIKTNAAAEKARLAAKYGFERVDKLFPGSEPKLPKNFILAVRTGLGTALPVQRLFDQKVTLGMPVAAS